MPAAQLVQVKQFKQRSMQMNWDQIEGKWMQVKGSVKQKWSKLTDDDLEYIAGARERFVGRLQERYGVAKEEAQRRADEWLDWQTARGLK
jgi:uncharacterized protein YjbJ (UPF0337 family)